MTGLPMDLEIVRRVSQCGALEVCTKSQSQSAAVPEESAEYRVRYCGEMSLTLALTMRTQRPAGKWE